MTLRRLSLRPLLSILIVLAAACASLLGAPQAAPQTAKPYRILICNDDGVRAPGILAVARALQSVGEVLVVAPLENQSGKGHSITISEPILREDLTLPGGIRAIGLAATPASTMKVALMKIVTAKPDLVVSGINRGYNLGLAAYLSGPAGAAREAASQGIPAIASSLSMPATDYTAAAEATARIAWHIKEHGLPAGAFLNVNIPSGTPETWKGFRIATQAMSGGGVEGFEERKHPNGRTYYWNVYEEGGTAPEGTDMWAVQQGYVAIVPMKVGEYNAEAAASLKTLTAAARR